jgi:hypothetical protein
MNIIIIIITIFLRKSKREERIENEDREVSSSSEYRREFEDVRVAA